MEVKKYHKHCQAMERLEAQDLLKEFRVASFPNLKQDAQSKLHREIQKRAFPKEEKVYSFDDIEKALGIG